MAARDEEGLKGRARTRRSHDEEAPVKKFVNDPADVLATTAYGAELTAAVRRGHVWGTQFHPEKSSRAGFRLLQNFVEGVGC